MGAITGVKMRCIFCGGEVTGRIMHRQCIIDDIYETIASGKPLDSTQYTRAGNNDISIKDIRQEVYQDALGRISR